MGGRGRNRRSQPRTLGQHLLPHHQRGQVLLPSLCSVDASDPQYYYQFTTTKYLLLNYILLFFTSPPCTAIMPSRAAHQPHIYPTKKLVHLLGPMSNKTNTLPLTKYVWNPNRPPTKMMNSSSIANCITNTASCHCTGSL